MTKTELTKKFSLIGQAVPELSRDRHTDIHTDRSNPLLLCSTDYGNNSLEDLSISVSRLTPSVREAGGGRLESW